MHCISHSIKQLWLGDESQLEVCDEFQLPNFLLNRYDYKQQYTGVMQVL
jgi:hypothetical protein